MCIGNRNGGDDAVGPYIADKLKDQNIYVINCGVTPENYTHVIKKHNPQKLIIIDAVDMGIDSGEIRIVPKEKISLLTISTHSIPISVLIDYLEKYIKNIIFIGIQPKKLNGKISNIIKINAERLIDILKSRRINQLKILN
jgi:hydrogenase 3 maturation protease